MEALEENLKLMVKTFRRERHRVLQSERTTVHGADSMLMVLQLAMAEVSKKVSHQSGVVGSKGSTGDSPTVALKCKSDQRIT